MFVNRNKNRGNGAFDILCLMETVCLNGVMSCFSGHGAFEWRDMRNNAFECRDMPCADSARAS